jgi:hypothetical protein
MKIRADMNDTIWHLRVLLVMAVCIVCLVMRVSGQSVGIGIDFPQATLDVTDDSSGILIPRVMLTGTDDILTVPGPITSELLYNTDSAGIGSTSVIPGFYYWDGTRWVRLSTGEDADWFEQNTVTAPDLITDTIYTYGHVGIGVNTPLAPLQVEAVGLGNPATNSIVAFNTQTSLTDRDAIITARVNGDGDGDPFFTVDILGESGWAIGIDNSDANKLKISNVWNNLDNGGGSTKITIQDTDGFVGIGGTAPLARLDVSGNVAVNDNQIRLRAGNDANHFIQYVGGSIDGPVIQGNLHTAIRSSARDLGIFIDYNVGNNDWPGLYTGFSYAGGQTGGSFGESVRVVRGRNGDGTLEFLNDGWGRLGGSNGLAFWSNGNADGDDAPAILLTQGGNTGIGTTLPAYTLEVNGTAGKPGGGAWTASSDSRLKKNITPYTDGLQTILLIDPVSYQYNELSGYDTEIRYVGVLAQELQKIAPYMVGTYQKDGETYFNVDNSAMTYLLINAVKELAAQNIELTNRVEGLEMELKHLSAKP